MTDTAHKKIKIGISGKRDIPFPDAVKKSIGNAIRSILKKENTKLFTGYTALAKGADTLFAEVVADDFQQEIKVALPFSSEEYANDFTESADLAAYQSWIKKTGTSKVVIDGKPQNSEQRNEAYFLVGKYLVDECDYMIFVWDELKPRGRGGTSEILGYASKSKSLKGFEIIKIKSSKTDEIDKDINTQLNVTDKEAIRLKTNYERVWLASIILGWLTATCLALTFSFHFTLFQQLIFSFLELLFEKL